VKLPLELRWAQNVGTEPCFVCSLPVSETHGYITGFDSRDRHSRRAHTWCWTLVLRYAQCVLDAQEKGEAVQCPA
jgi:hypothetical protein